MPELDVIGVRVEMPSNNPIVLLRESGGLRCVPIWIGAVEATAIAFAQQGVVPPRPLTHDLLKDLLGALGASLSRVVITEMREGTFYAELVLDNGVTVSSRPSDSIALALRTRSPIFAPESLLEQVGVVMDDESEESSSGDGEGAADEDEVARFRAFLDHVEADDFDP